MKNVYVSGILLALGLTCLSGCGKAPREEEIPPAKPAAPVKQPEAPPKPTNVEPPVLPKAPVEPPPVAKTLSLEGDVDPMYVKLVTAVKMKDAATVCSLLSSNVRFKQVSADKKTETVLNRDQYCQTAEQYFKNMGDAIYDPQFSLIDIKPYEYGKDAGFLLTLYMLDNILTVESKTTHKPSIQMAMKQSFWIQAVGSEAKIVQAKVEVLNDQEIQEFAAFRKQLKAKQKK